MATGLRRISALSPPRWLAARALSSPSLADRLGNMIRGDEARQAGARKLEAERAKGASLSDAIHKGMMAYRAEKKENLWLETNLKMIKLDTFGFEVMRDQLAEALKETDSQTMMQRAGLKADRLRGGNQEAMLEQMQSELREQIKLIDALNPSERRKPELLTRRARIKLAEELGLESTKPVDELVQRYEMMRIQWGWLRRERQRGRPLPDSPEDLQWRMRNRPTREFMRVMRRESERNMPMRVQRDMRRRMS